MAINSPFFKDKTKKRKSRKKNFRKIPLVFMLSYLLKSTVMTFYPIGNRKSIHLSCFRIHLFPKEMPNQIHKTTYDQMDVYRYPQWHDVQINDGGSMGFPFDKKFQAYQVILPIALMLTIIGGMKNDRRNL